MPSVQRVVEYRKQRGLDRTRKLVESGGLAKAAEEYNKKQVFGAIGTQLSKSSNVKRNAPRLNP